MPFAHLTLIELISWENSGEGDYGRCTVLNKVTILSPGRRYAEEGTLSLDEDIVPEPLNP